MNGENVRKYNLYMEIGAAFGIFAPILLMVVRSLNDLFSPGWDTQPQSHGFFLALLSQIIIYTMGFGLIIIAQIKQRVNSLLIINLFFSVTGLVFLYIQLPYIKEEISIYNTQVFLPGYILCFLAMTWLINIIREKSDNFYLWIGLIFTSFLTSIGLTEALGSYFYINEFNYIINKNNFLKSVLQGYSWIIYLWTIVIWFYYSFIVYPTKEVQVIQGIKIKHLVGMILAILALFTLPTWVSVEIKNTESMRRLQYQVDIEPTTVEGNTILINVPFPKYTKVINKNVMSIDVFDLRTKQIRKDVGISFINSRYGNMLRIRADKLGNGISLKASIYLSNKTKQTFPIYLQPRIDKKTLNPIESPLSYSGVNSTSPIYYEIKGDKLSFNIHYTVYDSIIDGRQEAFSQVIDGFIGKEDVDKQQDWQFNSVLDKF